MRNRRDSAGNLHIFLGETFCYSERLALFCWVDNFPLLNPFASVRKLQMRIALPAVVANCINTFVCVCVRVCVCDTEI